jgi:membrane-associated phospholipid phosphatase
MNPFYEWGIGMIAWLQASAPWLRGPMSFFSFWGNQEFFFLLLPFLYWCVDARLGARVGIILNISYSINTFFKLIFHAPRPYWVSRQVQAMNSEASYGLPSGHAQHAMSIWGVVGAAGKAWLRWVMVVLIFLIGFSRIVLAVHFPTDVLLGWLIGGLVLWAFLRWEALVLAWVNRHTLAEKIGLAAAASMLLIAIPLFATAFLPPADPPEWETTAAIAYPPAPGERAINPRDMTETVGVAGAFLGLVVGVTLLFHQTRFSADGEWGKRVLRYALGAVGVAIVWMGLRLIFPRDASLVSQVLRYLRYALAGFWISYGAPWLFIKLRLSDIRTD